MKEATKIDKIDRSVVRNQAYPKSAIGIRERHNERKNQGYSNPDIVKERSHFNVNFKTCDGGYEEVFDRMVMEGTISTRGLKEDAKVFDEMVFDVNSDYFERSGGYEYAKQFYEEAFRLAVKEAGGEQYILSAIMHADERNKALSEQLGRDVFHYHLHVVYIPVVDKEVRWTKHCKDPALVGTVKEVIKQVSHSKKWPKEKRLDDHGEPLLSKNGRPILVNSYSLLQDRFFEHMRDAGFVGFERGERGSTAEHLDVLNFKIKQDEARDESLVNTITEKEKQSSALNEKIALKQQAAFTFSEIESMGKKTVLGKVQITPVDWEKVSGLAKEGVLSRGIIYDLRKQVTALKSELIQIKTSLNKLIEETRQYREIVRLFPQQVKEFFTGLVREKEQNNVVQQKSSRKRNRDTSR